MPKRKYIEDSDEEDEGEDGPQAKEVKLDGETAQVGGNQRDLVGGSSDIRSTNSTEKLNREMQNAHKDLLEPTPTHNKFLARTSMDELQATGTTTPSIQSLRKHTTTSLEKARVGKDVKTALSQEMRHTHNARDVFEFHGSSDGETDIKSQKRKPSQILNRSGWGKEDETQKLPEIQNGSCGTYLQGSDSNTIPTVPNSTPPRPCNSSAMRTTSDHEQNLSYPQSQADERMPTPTISSHSRSTANGSYKAIQEEAMTHPPAVPNLHPDEPEAQQRPTLGTSAIDPSKTMTVNPGGTAINEAIRCSHHSEKEDPTSLPTFHTAGLLRPMVVLPEAPDHSLSLDQVSMPAPDVQITKTVKVSDEREMKRHNQNAADDLGSDDISIGLPREQYKPRPSRSRGNPNDDDVIVPVDYSKRPETVAKGKNETKKRKRKQSVAAEVIAKSEGKEETMEKHEVPNPDVTRSDINPPENPTDAEGPIEDGQPSKMPASKAQTTEVDDLLTQGSVKKGPKLKKQRGRPKKAIDVDVQAPRTEQGVREDDSKSKKDTASNNKRPAKGGQSKKSQSVVDSDSEDEEETVKRPAKRGERSKDCQSIVKSDSESEAETPRKRGQTGKNSQSVLDSDSENGAEILEEHKSDPQAQQAADPERSALKEPTGNPNNAKLSSKTTNKTDAAQPENLPPVTPPKAAGSTPKGPTKHSPISAGLSKYRVGLSKRARIEPLLRVVRK